LALKIRPIQVGHFPTFERSVLAYGIDPGVKMRAPCIAWIIEGGSEPVLVDTGPYSEELARRYHYSDFERPPKMHPVAALRRLGVAPESLRYVILTHLHWDHCANLADFPNASFFVQERELHYAVAPLPVHRRAYDLGLQGTRPAWLEGLERIEAVRGDVDILPGIRLVTLPGHTVGSQGVVVNTDRGRYLIAGDTIALQECWNPSAPDDSIPSGIHVNLTEYYETFAKMAKIADYVLAAHDFKTLDREVYP
jgi:N-acyl homoserine lactone hydrolase